MRWHHMVILITPDCIARRSGYPILPVNINDPGITDYALHPALDPLKSIYDAGDLALVHATGVPHQIRSHFSAQNLIERGVVDKLGPSTGWLGRHLALRPPASNSAFRAIAISGNVPVALSGAQDPLAIDNLNDFGFDQGIIDSGYPAGARRPVSQSGAVFRAGRRRAGGNGRIAGWRILPSIRRIMARFIRLNSALGNKMSRRRS